MQTYGIRNRWEMNVVFSLRTLREVNFEDGDVWKEIDKQILKEKHFSV